MKNIINDPFHYKNRLLETVSDRHLISVKMLTYLYEGGFTSDDIWNYLEDYFLGSIPEKVKRDCLAEMIAKGTDAKTVADILVHSNPNKTLSVYTHVFNEVKAKATDEIVDMLHLNEKF